MARDIEDFLRKAAERRKQAQGGGGAPPPQAPPPQSPQPRPAQPNRQQPARPKKKQPARPALVEAEMVRRGATVSDHVRAHIDTSDVSEHARHLGEEVGLADDKLEQRLHEKFDHSVGDLQRKKRTEPVQIDVSMADELLQMLRDPKTVRQAIILNEILRRPNF